MAEDKAKKLTPSDYVRIERERRAGRSQIEHARLMAEAKEAYENMLKEAQARGKFWPIGARAKPPAAKKKEKAPSK